MLNRFENNGMTPALNKVSRVTPICYRDVSFGYNV